MTGVATAVVDNILANADAQVAAWVEDRLGGDVVTVPFKALGILDDAGKIVGGAYFYSYRKGDANDITIAVAVDDHANVSRDAIRKILAYPFGQLDLPRISAEIDESNSKAIDQAERIGFCLEGVKRSAGRNGGDILLFGLLRRECKFWNVPETMK